ncbi:sensor domain-containing protein [Actinosynnema pretiosum subsp. pretiosum]|uniref:histidine kinase n=1 Tax=Actinosynnema pretiosum subsp. pretiosum TaxID=103721 RepID=A0AA45R3T5_9PSEU|nr:sensor domain-containing protein [Actinosynnema pretiosum subsp. pretiosum]
MRVIDRAAAPRPPSGPGRGLLCAPVDGLRSLLGALGTAVPAFVVLALVPVVAALCLVGLGIPLVPRVSRAVRAVADRERGRLSRVGAVVAEAEPLPDGVVPSVRATARELGWLAWHGTCGLALAACGVMLPLNAVHDLTFPLYWDVLPPGEITAAIGFPAARDGREALLVSGIGLGWAVLALIAPPVLAGAHVAVGRALLGPAPGTDLTLRVIRLTATRAAALDAHAVELRRIERSLHDGAQNHLVAVNLLVGAARRVVHRDPAAADAVLDRAQEAAEQALSELRAVVRAILPPVLDDRTLGDAVAALAANCPVPCAVVSDVPVRSAASVEATAYFVVAEALTNIARHSGARRAEVRIEQREGRLRVTISDDGRGGADARGGSGLDGIRRRVEAHDGVLLVSSPVGGPTAVGVSLPCGS